MPQGDGASGDAGKPPETGRPAKGKTSAGGSFGTFKGVFTPSLLTILGVIMYLRVGWVLGNAGLFKTLVIVTLSTAVTFLTGLSIAATATNMKVGVGGAYFMISRSLGVEAGAAIGLPLFFAQALGVSFYTVGFAESVNNVFPHLPIMPVGVATLVVLAALAYISADLALKTQFFILAAIAVSLISFFLGGPPEAGFAPVKEALPEVEPFWVVFAVFFPAVTGIEAGIAMSGDLKDPGKALPRGTLGAIVAGYLVYIAIPILLTVWVPREVLLSDSMVMQKVARWGEAILVGVWGATLSSALGALLGAPRTLQALARDRVMPRFLGRGSGPNNEPRIATAVAFAVALVGIVAGSLNVIAPVLSMFFLTSYGFLNLSAGLEGLIGSPSWRPQFRTPWWVSLMGAVLCLVIMFMINPGATFAASVVCGGVFYVMGRRRMRAYWGDMRHGLLMLLARFAIYRLADTKPDARTWRPNMLVLSGIPASRWHLIEFADDLSHGSGFLTVATVIPEGSAQATRISDVEKAIAGYLRKRRTPALVEVHVADDVMAGAQSLMQSSGVGPLFPNTVVIGVSEDPENLPGYARLVKSARTLSRNLIVLREPAYEPPPDGSKTIHVWWGGQRENAGLMLALGYLLQSSAQWQGARLIIKTIVREEAEQEHALARLKILISRGRLRAEAEVVLLKEGSPFDLIREESRHAHRVFLGLRPPDEEESVEAYGAYYADLMSMTEGFPATAFILAAEEIDFHRIFD